MKTNQLRRQNITKVYAAFITLMLFAAIGGLISYQHSHRTLSDSLENRKIKMEEMLSEKLLLEEEIVSMKAELKAMQGQNFNLDTKLKKAISSSDEKERRINVMTGENDKAKKLIAEVNTLRDLRKNLEQEIAGLKGNMQQLLAENSALKTKVDELRVENEELTQNLSQVVINNALVEATKGKKDRLTVKAKKARKVKVGFELPEEMIGNLFFQMTTPSGQIVTSDHSTISVTEDYSDAELIASIEPFVAGKTSNKKQIDMVYEPKEKLERGIYKIAVYSGDQYLGTTRVHLR